MIERVCVVVALCVAAPVSAQVPPPARQNPSPMVETTRRHERLPEVARAGERFTIAAVLPRPVHVFIPEPARGHGTVNLLVHFHGAAYVAEQAAVAR